MHFRCVVVHGWLWACMCSRYAAEPADIKKMLDVAANWHPQLTIDKIRAYHHGEHYMVQLTTACVFHTMAWTITCLFCISHTCVFACAPGRAGDLLARNHDSQGESPHWLGPAATPREV